MWRRRSFRWGRWRRGRWLRRWGCWGGLTFCLPFVFAFRLRVTSNVELNFKISLQEEGVGTVTEMGKGLLDHCQGFIYIQVPVQPHGRSLSLSTYGMGTGQSWNQKKFALPK